MEEGISAMNMKCHNVYLLNGRNLYFWQKENEMQEGRLRQKGDEWLPRAGGEMGRGLLKGSVSFQGGENVVKLLVVWLHESECTKIH